ncbi:MAG TPA: ribonuclease III [Chloroflexi bacterium]|nr:ribonuclease III [Chloroflexota bacterium]
MMDLSAFQNNIGLHFRDQSLLLRALTHPSYLNEHPKQGLEDNQRLEFLGDAILDFISSEWLYHRFPEAPEGRLTRLRAALVRTETLAELAVKCHINEALLLGKGEEESGGRKRQTNLCAAYEAFIGALYLDQGIEVVRDFVQPQFQETLERVLQLEMDKDPKSQLQEWAQAHLGLLPVYKTVRSEGPDHAKRFTIAVFIGEKRYAEGSGPNKQAAAQQAARQALRKLQAVDRA